MDYMSGEIKQNGKVVSKFYGSYMGYLEFDGVRYWDIRTCPTYKVFGIEVEKSLNSDWRKRTDTLSL